MSATALVLACIGFGTLVCVTGGMMLTARWEHLSRTEFTANPAATVAGGLVLIALGIGVAVRDSGPAWAAPACLAVAILSGLVATTISLLGARQSARPDTMTMRESNDER